MENKSSVCDRSTAKNSHSNGSNENAKQMDEQKTNEVSSPQILKNQSKNDGEESSLSGLFYVGLINLDRSKSSETFLVCRTFWHDSAILTENCRNNILNYLEVFSSCAFPHPFTSDQIVRIFVVIQCSMRHTVL